jgi:uncharacterized protein VirK/YbjX
VNGRAEQPELAHLAHDVAIEGFLQISLGDARQQPLLRITFGSVTDETLLIRKLTVQRERIRPVERKTLRFGQFRFSREVAPLEHLF